MKNGNLSINSENIFPVIKKWLYSDHDIADFLKKFNMIFEDPAPHLMPDFFTHRTPVSTHFV